MTSCRFISHRNRLADGRTSSNLTLTDGGIRAERSREVHTIARPPRDQTFGVGNSRCGVLHDVALDVTPFAVTVTSVALSAEVDGINAVAPEDVSAKTSQARHALEVADGGDKVRLVELNARRRQFNDFGQIDRNQTVHLHQAHRSVLQDVDGGVVAVVGKHVAQSERVNVIVFRLNLCRECGTGAVMTFVARTIPPIGRYVATSRTLIHIRCALMVAHEFRLYLR